MRSIYLTLVVVALSLAALMPAAGQEAPLGAANWDLVGQPDGPPISGTELDLITEEVAGIMRCPVCQGLSIADSPTALAIAMKAEVKEMLSKGYSESQVLDYFEQSYGEFIRLEPKARGFNLFVWLAPLAVLLGGLLFLAARMRKPAAAVSESTSAKSSSEAELDTYRERVRREVAS
jgi:cytochrome c-type biogenesis protein CcmH